jgi:hypothetical protein
MWSSHVSAGVHTPSPGAHGVRFSPRITPELEKTVEAVYADAGARATRHPVITLTRTQSGHLAKLRVEGAPLERDLVLHDETGQVQAGVGLVLHQESRFGVYVASVTAGGPADLSGRIKPDDVLVQVDDYLVTPESSLEDVRRRILGPPGRLVCVVLRRTSCTAGQDEDHGLFTVALPRANPHYLREQTGGDQPISPRTPRLRDGVLVELVLSNVHLAQVLLEEEVVKASIRRDLASALRSDAANIVVRGLRPGLQPLVADQSAAGAQSSQSQSTQTGKMRWTMQACLIVCCQVPRGSMH